VGEKTGREREQGRKGERDRGRRREGGREGGREEGREGGRKGGREGGRVIPCTHDRVSGFRFRVPGRRPRV
jgi:hypothetical protein